MLVLSTPTYGKQDAPKFRASDLIPNFAAYTGRAQRTEQQIEDMVTSLLNHGQEQAFLFRKGFQDQAIPVTGHTRILAADRITKRRLRGTAGGAVEVQFGPETPFLLMGTYRQMNEFEALIHTFTENDPDSRTPLNDMDYAFLIRTMNESFGVPDAEIATKLKKPASWVSTHRTLLNLEPEIQDKVRTGEMPFSHAQAIAKVAPEDRSTVLTKMATEGGKVTAERITQTAVAVGAKRKGSTTLSMSAFRKMVKGIADGPFRSCQGSCIGSVGRSGWPIHRFCVRPWKRIAFSTCPPQACWDSKRKRKLTIVWMRSSIWNL